MQAITKIKIHALLHDFRFWLIIFFIIRLTGITNPPLEMGHSWRQALTDMIARNFLETDANILYPRIDMAGNATGIIGAEFPLLNYIIYIISLVFGYQHWYGRLVNLLVSTIGIWYFYLLVRKLFSREIAFNAGIILCVSIWFGFSRKIMPDTFSIALTIAGLYYAYTYLENARLPHLLLSFVLLTAGVLCKIPALSYFSLFLLPWLIKRIPLKRKVMVSIIALFSFGLSALWYFYWVPYLLSTYHYQLYFPKGIAEGINEIIPLLPLAAEKFYFSSLLSYLAFACFLAGMYFMVKEKQKYFMCAFVIFLGVFVIFIIKTGAVFPMHSYYIIPFTPLMALIAGFGLSRAPKQWQYMLLFLISIEGMANQQHDFFIKPSEKYKLNLESIANKISDPKDLIMINGNNNPQLMYFAHRKGWNCYDADLADTSYLRKAAIQGCRVLIVNKHTSRTIPPLQNIYTDEDFEVYRMP